MFGLLCGLLCISAFLANVTTANRSIFGERSATISCNHVCVSARSLVETDRLASATITTVMPSLDSTTLGCDNAATRSAMTTLRMDAVITARREMLQLFILPQPVPEARNVINQIGANNTSAMSQPGCSNEIHTESLRVASIESWNYGAREDGFAGSTAGVLVVAAGV